MKRLNFLYQVMFTLLEGFQPKYTYKDIERNRINEDTGSERQFFCQNK